jgi:tetratricopeptide (TPR) repeat protein
MDRCVLLYCMLCVLTVFPAQAGEGGGRSECATVVERRIQDLDRLQSEGQLVAAARGLEGLLATLEKQPCAGIRLDPVLTRLGHVRQQLGLYREAEVLYRRALRIRKDAGDAQADAASSRSDIATALLSQGRMDEAEELLRAALAELDKVVGPHHIDTLVVRTNLGAMLLRSGQAARAEPVLRSVAAGLEKLQPRPNRMLATTYQNLAAAHFGQGEFREAARYTRMHLELAETAGVASDIAAAVSNLIAVLVEQQQFAEAEALLPRALELVSPAAAGGFDFAMLLISRAAIRRSQKRLGESAADLQDAISRMEQIDADLAPSIAGALAALETVLREQKLKNEGKLVKGRLRALLAAHGGTGVLSMKVSGFRAAQAVGNPE